MNISIQQQSQMSLLTSSQDQLMGFVQQTLPMNILQEINETLDENYFNKKEVTNEMQNLFRISKDMVK